MGYFVSLIFIEVIIRFLYRRIRRRSITLSNGFYWMMFAIIRLAICDFYKAVYDLSPHSSLFLSGFAKDGIPSVLAANFAVAAYCFFLLRDMVADLSHFGGNFLLVP